jgi:hypothetical protein
MTKTFSGRRVPQVVVAAALVVGGFAVMAGAASAHHGSITAQAGCSGAVSYTVTDWKSFGPGSINPDIRVSYRTSGGLVTVVDGAFTAAQIAFSGTFTPVPDTPGTLVQVEAEAIAPWGDGAPPGSTRSTSVTIPAVCTTTTTGPTTTTGLTPTTGLAAAVPPARVLGTEVTAAPAVATQSPQTLAATGTNIRWSLGLGVLLILLGASTFALGIRSDRNP